MPHEADYFDFEKMLWHRGVDECSSRHNISHQLFEVVRIVFAADQRFQFAAVPTKFADLGVLNCLRPNDKLLAIREACQSSHTAKSTSTRTSLLARAERHEAFNKFLSPQSDAVVANSHNPSLRVHGQMNLSGTFPQ